MRALSDVDRFRPFLMLASAWLLVVPPAWAQAPPPAPPAPSVERTSYILSGIDVFGATKTPESEILKLIDVKEGEEVGPDKVTQLDKKLRASGKFAYSQVSITNFGNKKSFLSVDVVEKGDEHRIQFNPAPTGSVAVPASLLDWVRRYEKASFNLFQVRPRGQADIEQGHYLDSDGGVRQYQEKMLEMVPENFDILVKALREDKDPEKRVVCATLLGYAKDKRAVIAPLEGALKDPVVEVRASAARSLVPIAYLAAHTAVAFPLDPVIEMVHYPTSSDRMKAVAVLIQLAADPANQAPIRERDGGVLVQMASAHQPAQREHSLVLLSLITGETYGKDVAKWKDWWKAMQAGTWKPPKPPEAPKKKEKQPPVPPSSVKS